MKFEKFDKQFSKRFAELRKQMIDFIETMPIESTDFPYYGITKEDLIAQMDFYFNSEKKIIYQQVGYKGWKESLREPNFTQINKVKFRDLGWETPEECAASDKFIIMARFFDSFAVSEKSRKGVVHSPSFTNQEAIQRSSNLNLPINALYRKFAGNDGIIIGASSLYTLTNMKKMTSVELKKIFPIIIREYCSEIGRQLDEGVRKFGDKKTLDFATFVPVMMSIGYEMPDDEKLAIKELIIKTCKKVLDTLYTGESSALLFKSDAGYLAEALDSIGLLGKTEFELFRELSFKSAEVYKDVRGNVGTTKLSKLAPLFGLSDVYDSYQKK